MTEASTSTMSAKTLIKYRILPILLALLSSISLAAVVSVDSIGSGSFLERFSDEIDGIGAAYLVVIIALALFYIKFWDGFRESSNWVTHLLAALFGIFMLIGMSYEATDSWDFIFGCKRDFAFALVVFAGYFVLFDFCM